MKTTLLVSLALCAAALACSSASSPAGPGDGGSGSPGDAGCPVTKGKDTWSSYAEGFFSTYCVHCHDGTTEPQDFRQYSQVKALTSTIRCGVAPTLQSGCPTSGFPPPKQFPIGSGPFPSDCDRDRVVAWIAAGAPQ